MDTRKETCALKVGSSCDQWLRRSLGSYDVAPSGCWDMRSLISFTVSMGKKKKNTVHVFVEVWHTWTQRLWIFTLYLLWFYLFLSLVYIAKVLWSKSIHYLYHIWQCKSTGGNKREPPAERMKWGGPTGQAAGHKVSYLWTYEYSRGSISAI